MNAAGSGDEAFLPKVDTSDGSGVDTWKGVNLQLGYADAYVRSFAAGTSQAEALAILTAQDLPPDAQLASSTVGGTCLLLVYRSLDLARMVPQTGDVASDAQIHVALYSSESASPPYSPTNVVDAILDPASNAC